MDLEDKITGVLCQKLRHELFAGGLIVAERLGALMKMDALGHGNLAEGGVLGIDPNFIKDTCLLALADGPGNERHAAELTQVFLFQPLAAHSGGNHGNVHVN